LLRLKAAGRDLTLRDRLQSPAIIRAVLALGKSPNITSPAERIEPPGRPVLTAEDNEENQAICSVVRLHSKKCALPVW
jgi:hypothetical protein